MNLAAIPPPAPWQQEAEIRNALQAALLEAVLCSGLGNDDPDHENAVDLYLRANVLYLRAHELPVASCCELGDVLEEIRHHLGLPDVDPRAVGLFTRCARCGYERGEHAAEAPHAITGECAGWEAP